jgi:S-(hydroxymethyl)glutathione dehydrogenase/alcohol dehydrogenase
VRLSRDGEPIRHFMGTSTFAEYTVMPEIALAKVSPDAPLEGACLFACGLSTGLGAPCTPRASSRGRRASCSAPGWSASGIVAGCRLQGAERIICIDLSEERLELARGQGATDTWTGGPTSCSACSTRPAGSAPTTRSRRPGLVAVMRRPSRRRGWAGACARSRAWPARARRSTSSPGCSSRGRRICGSSFGGVKGRDQVPELVDRWLAGEIDVAPFLSHRITLDEVNHGFELLEAQDGIRSVIEFGT